jgi:hypothetical protein
MSSLGRRIGSFLGFSVLSLALVGGTSVIWGALVIGNIRTTPSIPWSLPLLFVMLWLVWQYLSGRGWPETTSRSRKRLLRANPVSREALSWSIVAGLFAIIALAGFWIVAFRLFPMQANLLLPAQFTSSRILIAAIINGVGTALSVSPRIDAANRREQAARLREELAQLGSLDQSSAIIPPPAP